VKSLKKASELQLSSVPLTTLFPSSAIVWKQLESYQQNAVRFAYQQKTSALFFEPGTGKTWIAAGLLECLGSNLSALLVVPKNNKETSWLDTLRKLFPHLLITSDWETFKRAKYVGILLLHYQQVHKLISRLVRREWTVIIYDELQALKGRGSKNSRCARRLRDRSEYKLGLTGTPADGKPEDIWAQMRFVVPDCFGENWKKFTKRYMTSTGFMGYKKVFREDKRERFNAKLSKWAICETKAVLNLPPLHVKQVWIDANERQRQAYDDMRVLRHVRLTRDVSVTASLTITRDALLSQIAGGFVRVRDDDTDDVYWLSYRKVAAVQRLIRQQPGPVVVFCRFIPELLMLQAKLSKRYRVATYYGKTRNKAEVQRDFQAGKYDILLCQIRAGGVGLDLYKARTTILYSADWSSINFDQLKSRFHRRGQEFEVTIFLLMIRRTIDAKLHRRILTKSNSNKQTTEGIKMAKVKPEAKTEVKAEYVIADLSAACDLDPSVTRQKLRAAGVEKVDGRYVWTKKKEFDEVVKIVLGGKPAKVEEPAKKNGKGKEVEKAPKNKASAVPETKVEKKRPKPQGARD